MGRPFDHLVIDLEMYNKEIAHNRDKYKERANHRTTSRKQATESANRSKHDSNKATETMSKVLALPTMAKKFAKAKERTEF